MREKGTTIISIKARQIFDSRGNPTVEVDLHTDLGLFRSAVPSGASTGVYEAVELRDNDNNYHKKGVSKAVENVNKIIAPKLIGRDVCEQKAIDDFMVKELDGSKNEWGWNKSKLGANAILGVSLSVCRAGAAACKLPLYKYIAKLANNDKIKLPIPSFNIINGGSHAGNNLAMQEFMVMPVCANSFAEAMKMGSEIYHHLKTIIKSTYGQDATNVGDEGGFAPNIQKNKEALELITKAVSKAGYSNQIRLASDIAASEFYVPDSKKYNLKFKSKTESEIVDSEALLEMYKDFAANYKVVSIEDPFDQDDWESWKKMTAAMEGTIVVGDDLLVTNPNRIRRAIETKACNALLLKVNQIGTVTESIEAVQIAKSAGWKVMTSHRSGETEDTFIADLAVGLSTDFIKTGAPCRSERLAKYNQLLRIEEEMGSEAVYNRCKSCCN